MVYLVDLDSRMNQRKENEKLIIDQCVSDNYTFHGFIDPIEQTSVSKSRIGVTCPNGHYYTPVYSRFMSNQRCKKCHDNKKIKGFSYYQEKLIDHLISNNYTYLGFEGTFSGSTHPINVKCNVCGNEWSTAIQLLAIKKTTCFKCNNTKLAAKLSKPYEYYVEKILNVCNDKGYEFIEILHFDVFKSNASVKFKCLKHDTIYDSVSVSNFIDGVGCKKCIKYNFDNTKEGYVYVCKVINKNTGHSFVGYGKTNIPDQRKQQHIKQIELHGYTMHDWVVTKMMTGTHASITEVLIKDSFNNSEICIKGFIRENSDIDSYQPILDMINNQNPPIP